MSELRAAVLLPTRDRAEDLERTLATLREQRLPPDWRVELIAVDDGSRDRTPRVLEEFARAPGPFHVRILHLAGGGKSAALNRAMQETAAPILVFTDDDMDHEPDWLAALVQHLEACSCVGVHGRIEVGFPMGRPGWMTRKAELLLGASHEAARADGSVRHLSGGNMAVRAPAARSAGPFREDLGPRGARVGYSEDVEWSLRVAEQGRLCYCGAAGNVHRIPRARARRRYLWRRQFDYARTEWRLRLAAGEPRPSLLRELRSLLGALLVRRQRFEGLDYGLEIAARLGRLAAVAEDLRRPRQTGR